MQPADSTKSPQPYEPYEPYDRVMQALAALVRRLADETPGVESLWMRHQVAGHEPHITEVSREFSLVINVGTVVAVRVEWYDVNSRGWSSEHELIYDRLEGVDDQDCLDDAQPEPGEHNTRE